MTEEEYLCVLNFIQYAVHDFSVIFFAMGASIYLSVRSHDGLRYDLRACILPLLELSLVITG